MASAPLQVVEAFTAQALFEVFIKGFDFSAYAAKHGSANLLDDKGEPLNMNEGMLSDAIATTVGVICFTYNISYGIAFGLISYIVISLFCGDAKKIKGTSWVIGALFVAMLILTH